MKRLVLKSTLSAAALAVSLGTIMTVKAGPVDETLVKGESVRTEAVTFSRAEISTEAGREAFERRVRRAAENVCGPQSYHLVGNLGAYGRNKACFKEAVDQAMAQVSGNQVASTAR